MYNGALARLHTTLPRIGKGPRDMVICRCTMLLWSTQTHSRKICTFVALSVHAPMQLHSRLLLHSQQHPAQLPLAPL